MIRKTIRTLLATALLFAMPLSSFAAEARVIVRDDVTVTPTIATSNSADVKIINKLLSVQDQLLSVVEQGYDQELAKLDETSMQYQYFAGQRDNYVDAVNAVYSDMTLSSQYDSVYEGAGMNYVKQVKSALAGYKDNVLFLRSYTKNPSAFDASDADKKRIESQMLEMQNVFVTAWDKWFGPYFAQDYQQKGKTSMTFTSEVADASLSYDSYTSIMSLLRGEQSTTLDTKFDIKFKQSDLLPAEMQGRAATVHLVAGVKMFDNEVYVSIDTIDFTVDDGFDAQAKAQFQILVDHLRGKTIRIPLQNGDVQVPSGAAVLKAFNDSIHELATTSIFTPVLRNRDGDFVLAVNPAAINNVSDIILPVVMSDASDIAAAKAEAQSTPLLVPNVVWHQNDNLQGEFYMAFSPAEDQAIGYIRLAYDRPNTGLIFTVRATDTNSSDTYLNVDMDVNRYLVEAQLTGFIAFHTKLDWNGDDFDFILSGLDSDNKTTQSLTVQGTAAMESKINLVGNYDQKQIFTLSYERVDTRSTYAFNLTSEIPPYSLGNLKSVPFVFNLSGYYDDSFGTFPVDKPTTFVEGSEWLKQYQTLLGETDSELLDGLIQ